MYSVAHIYIMSRLQKRKEERRIIILFKVGLQQTDRHQNLNLSDICQCSYVFYQDFLVTCWGNSTYGQTDTTF